MNLTDFKGQLLFRVAINKISSALLVAKQHFVACYYEFCYVYLNERMVVVMNSVIQSYLTALLEVLAY